MITIIIQQVYVYIILAAIGMIAVKCKVFNETSLEVLSKFIMKISIPFWLFITTLNGVTRDELLGAYPTFFAALFVVGLCFSTGTLVSSLVGLRGNERNIFRCVFTFGNIGGIGIPLVYAILPEKGVLYIALYCLVDQTLLWTLGMYLTTPIKDTKGKNVLKNVKNLVNPSVVGILAGILGVLFGIQLPAVVTATFTAVGNMCLSLGLIYLGGLFMFIDIRAALRKFEFFYAIAIKMILLPTLLFLALKAISFPHDLSIVVTLICALPSMIGTAMFSKANGSNAEYAIGGVMLTTLSCFATLPLVGWIITCLS